MWWLRRISASSERSGKTLAVVPGPPLSASTGMVSAHSMGRTNSSPRSRRPSAACSRLRRAEMGGVSLGTVLDEDGEGAGNVNRRTWPERIRCVVATEAPVALIFRVFVSSTKSAPPASTPRRNTGTCRRIRDERRRSTEAWFCMGRRDSLLGNSKWYKRSSTGNSSFIARVRDEGSGTKH